MYISKASYLLIGFIFGDKAVLGLSYQKKGVAHVTLEDETTKTAIIKIYATNDEFDFIQVKMWACKETFEDSTKFNNIQFKFSPFKSGIYIPPPNINFDTALNLILDGTFKSLIKDNIKISFLIIQT